MLFIKNILITELVIIAELYLLSWKGFKYWIYCCSNFY